MALAPGASTTVGGYEFRFDGVQPIEGPNYDGIGATVTVTRGGAPVAVLKPEKRQYWVQRQLTSETAIRMSRGNNLLVALGDDLGRGALEPAHPDPPAGEPHLACGAHHGDRRRAGGLRPPLSPGAARRERTPAGAAGERGA